MKVEKERQQKDSNELNEFYASHNCGKHSVQLRQLTLPSDDILSRQINEKHVRDLVELIHHDHTVNPGIWVVVRSKVAHDLREGVDKKKVFAKNLMPFLEDRRCRRKSFR